ncbi:hypothetical protein EZV62_001921 [Acer yangbiense]|uniref:Uncharacterized protein n=1 Tax=Acer yangbiense TaxID=1000413 RepID=A0A5C7IXM2_9ROSI|nr:hypothetical protein EZV62_001921 [Acer yangbiense]
MLEEFHSRMQHWQLNRWRKPGGSVEMVKSIVSKCGRNSRVEDAIDDEVDVGSNEERDEKLEDPANINDGDVTFSNHQRTSSVMRPSNLISEPPTKKQLFPPKGELQTPKSKIQTSVPSNIAELYSAMAVLIKESEERMTAFYIAEFTTMKNSERLANIALAGLTLAPLLVKVDPNLNVILTASLTVFVGCYRSVKPTPPTETMSKEHAMRFPFVGSAMLLSLFLLFKFLSKDLVNTVLTCYFFVLGIIALSATVLPAIKRFLPKHWNDDLIIWRFPYVRALEVEFTRSQIVAAIPGTFFCAWYASQKHWLANNILGLSFCIQGIEMLSLGSFKTGAILLAGLFVYDIFWVFFTPVMVSVAKSFDAPIKLLFPTADAARPFSMLGLGDIVIPGIFVALALRFDVSRGRESQYFKSAFLGYTFGVVLTIIVMNWFQAAQPALLYIVPSVIGFLAAHCIWNGEVKPLMEFDESLTAGEDSDDKSSKKVE